MIGQLSTDKLQKLLTIFVMVVSVISISIGLMNALSLQRGDLQHKYERICGERTDEEILNGVWYECWDQGNRALDDQIKLMHIAFALGFGLPFFFFGGRWAYNYLYSKTALPSTTTNL